MTLLCKNIVLSHGKINGSNIKFLETIHRKELSRKKIMKSSI